MNMEARIASLVSVSSSSSEVVIVEIESMSILDVGGIMKCVCPNEP